VPARVRTLRGKGGNSTKAIEIRFKMRGEVK